MRDRVAIAAKQLQKIYETDYESERQKDIERASTVSGEWRESMIAFAHRSAEERKEGDLKTHFSYHAGHCAECEKPLEYFIYPLDRRIKVDRGRWGFEWKTENVYACEAHTQQLKGQTYKISECPVCHTPFKSASESRFCSTACRSFHDYHERNPKKYKPKRCAQCDQAFLSARSDSLYCCGTCRVAHHRATRKTVTDV